MRSFSVSDVPRNHQPATTPTVGVGVAGSEWAIKLPNGSSVAAIQLVDCLFDLNKCFKKSNSHAPVIIPKT